MRDRPIWERLPPRPVTEREIAAALDTEFAATLDRSVWAKVPASGVSTEVPELAIADDVLDHENAAGPEEPHHAFGVFDRRVHLLVLLPDEAPNGEWELPTEADLPEWRKAASWPLDLDGDDEQGAPGTWENAAVVTARGRHYRGDAEHGNCAFALPDDEAEATLRRLVEERERRRIDDADEPLTEFIDSDVDASAWGDGGGRVTADDDGRLEWHAPRDDRTSNGDADDLADAMSYLVEDATGALQDVGEIPDGDVEVEFENGSTMHANLDTAPSLVAADSPDLSTDALDEYLDALFAESYTVTPTEDGVEGEAEATVDRETLDDLHADPGFAVVDSGRVNPLPTGGPFGEARDDPLGRDSLFRVTVEFDLSGERAAEVLAALDESERRERIREFHAEG